MAGFGSQFGGPKTPQEEETERRAKESPSIWSQLKGALAPERTSQFGEIDQSGGLGRLGAAGENSWYDNTHRANQAMDYQRGLMQGENSVSAEQLRQGLQSNLSAQRAMAAGARPGNQAMAARTAAMQMGRMGSGMAGQQALAGLQERNQAAQNYANMVGQMRGQDVQLGLGSLGELERARAQRYGADMGVPGQGERLLGTAMGVGGLIAASDKRLKHDVKDGDQDADAFLSGLKAHTFKYKDGKKHGEGTQLGIMAQDLESTRLGKQAVIDTNGGKMVHGAKLATALAAALTRVNDRVKSLESKK